MKFDSEDLHLSRKKKNSEEEILNFRKYLQVSSGLREKEIIRRNEDKIIKEWSRIEEQKRKEMKEMNLKERTSNLPPEDISSGKVFR